MSKTVSKERVPISPEKFCEIVRSSSSVKEVAERTGLPAATVSTKIYHFKGKGVPMKDLGSRRRRVDWATLAENERAALKKDGVPFSESAAKETKTAHARRAKKTTKKKGRK